MNGRVALLLFKFTLAVTRGVLVDLRHSVLLCQFCVCSSVAFLLKYKLNYLMKRFNLLQDKDNNKFDSVKK